MMVRTHGLPLDEFGEWPHHLSTVCLAASAVGSLAVLWIYTARLHVLHNGLTALLVAASFGCLLQASAQLAGNVAASVGTDVSATTCNIALPAIISLVTLVTTALATYYVHIVIVRRHGELSTRRWLPVYAGVIGVLMCMTAAFTAVDFKTAGGVAREGANGHSYCEMPPEGRFVFIVPALMEVVMLFVGCSGIAQILCRRQSLSRQCRHFLHARALYVIFYLVLRASMIAYHIQLRHQDSGSSSGANDRGDGGSVTVLSVFALLNMIFDSLNGAVLCALFFWTEGGWELARRLRRRRWRRFTRRWQRANRAAERKAAADAYLLTAPQGMEEGADAEVVIAADSRCATYGSCRTGATSAAGDPRAGASDAFFTGVLAAGIQPRTQQQPPYSQLGLMPAAGVGPYQSPHDDLLHVNNRRAGTARESGGVRYDGISEDTDSTCDDAAAAGSGGGADRFRPSSFARGGVGSVELPSRAQSGLRAQIPDDEKDYDIRKQTLSGMLSFISEEIHGEIAPSVADPTDDDCSDGGSDDKNSCFIDARGARGRKGNLSQRQQQHIRSAPCAGPLTNNSSGFGETLA